MRYEDEEGRRGAPPGRLHTGLVPPTAAPPTRSTLEATLEATLDPPQPSKTSVVGALWPSTARAPETRLAAGRSLIDVNTPADGRTKC